MLLRWNEQRLLVVPLLKPVAVEALKGMSPSDAQVAITPTGTKVLYPGINDLDDSEWALAKPHVMDLLNRRSVDDKTKKALEQVSLTVGKSTGVTEFKKTSPNQANLLIKETVNPETLRKWDRLETRDSVRLYLKKQMETVGVESGPMDLMDEPADDPVAE